MVGSIPDKLLCRPYILHHPANSTRFAEHPCMVEQLGQTKFREWQVWIETRAITMHRKLLTGARGTDEVRIDCPYVFRCQRQDVLEPVIHAIRNRHVGQGQIVGDHFPATLKKCLGPAKPSCKEVEEFRSW